MFAAVRPWRARITVAMPGAYALLPRASHAADRLACRVIVDNALYRNGERVDLGLDTHDLAGVRAKATGAARLRLGRPARPRRATSSRPSPTSTTCTSSRSRTPSAPTSAPRSSATPTRCSSCSRPSGTSTRRTPSRPARSACSSATSSSSPCGTAQGGGLSGGPPPARGHASNVLAHGPSAVVYAVCDAVVDRYEEVAGSLAGGRRRGRVVGVLDRSAPTTPPGSTSSSASSPRCVGR